MDYYTLLENIASNIFFFGVMFIVTLMIVIIVHELGHYLAARICNVHVQIFSFGFGRELFGFGGGHLKTRWSVCIFPIGGFVQLFGDVDKNNPVIWDKENNCKRTLSEEELKVAFCTKSVWQRIFIVASGPAINLLLTFIIFFVTFSTYGQRSKPLFINVVSVSSPAYDAGIKIGDQFLEMDSKPLRRLDDIYDKTWYEIPPKEHEYKILRNGEEKTIKFAARYTEYINKKGVLLKHGQTGMLRLNAIKFKDISSVEGENTKNQPDKARSLLLKNLDKKIVIGIVFKGDKINKSSDKEEPDEFITYFKSNLNKHLNNKNHEFYDQIFLVDPDKKFYLRLPPIEAAGRALFWIKTIAVDSYKLLEAAYNGRNDSAVIGGVGKISNYTAKSAKAGFYNYMMFVAGFSLMIAFINLLPIPVLDGGYLLFLFYEAIMKKPVAPSVQNIAMIIGLVFLGGIMILANISDLISMFTAIDSK